MAPLLVNVEQTLAMDMAGLLPEQKVAVVQAKLAAKSQRDILRTALFLEDDDG